MLVVATTTVRNKRLLCQQIGNLSGGDWPRAVLLFASLLLLVGQITAESGLNDRSMSQQIADSLRQTSNHHRHADTLDQLNDGYY